MTVHKKTELVVDHRFDPKRCRHLIGDTTYVLHCHHYASLYCQLADDAELFDGKGMLRKASELSFSKELKRIFREQGASEVSDRVALAEQYWSFAGMGVLRFEKVGPASGMARMSSSHVDEGWIKKWGKRDKPVNFIGQGYLAAVFAEIYELPPGSYRVNEFKSIVSGDEASLFSIVRA